MSAQAKEEKEPSLTGSLIFGAFVAILGAFLVAAFLFTFEANDYPIYAEQDQELEDRELSYSQPEDAFYLKGAVARTSDWQKKRQEFISGSSTTLALKDSDVNAWFKANFYESQNTDDGSGLLLTPGTPNVSFGEVGKVHLSLPIEDELGESDGEFILAIIGSFAESAPLRFKMERFQLNSAQLPLAGALGEKILPSVFRVPFRVLMSFKRFLTLGLRSRRWNPEAEL